VRAPRLPREGCPDPLNVDRHSERKHRHPAGVHSHPQGAPSDSPAMEIDSAPTLRHPQCSIPNRRGWDRHPPPASSILVDRLYDFRRPVVAKPTNAADESEVFQYYQRTGL
jgi:hypothetical protein